MIFSGTAPGFNTKSAQIAVLFLVAATVLAAATLMRNVSFQAEVDTILTLPSDERRLQVDFETAFPQLFRTTTLAVETPAFGPLREPLETAILDLWLTEGVTQVTSVLSLDPPPADAPDAAAALRRALISGDETLTLVTVTWDEKATPEVRAHAARDFAQTLSAFARVTDISPPAVSAATAAALQADQTRLMGLSVAVCLGLSLWLMGGWRAAVVVTVPPLLGVVWSVAAISVLGIALNPLLMVVPTMLLVLGVADALHFAHAMAAQGGTTPARAAWTGMRQTLAAAAMTSLSTGAAFGVMALVAPGALGDLALFGVIGLAAQLLAVTLGTTALHAVLAPPPPPLHRPGARLITVAQRALRHHRAIAALAVAAVFATALTLPFLRASHDLRSALPTQADLTLLLERIDTQLAGADRLFLLTDAADPAPGLQQADAERLSHLGQAAFGLATPLPAQGNAALDAFVSQDGSTLALPVPVPLLAPSETLRQRAETLAAGARAALGGQAVRVTGPSLTAATEMPDLLWRLSAAFYATAALIGALAWGVLRSGRAALAFMIPNLLTLLSVSALFVLSGQALSMTGAIVMTVAFGIAVDDTIHLVHRLRQHKATAPDTQALAETLAQAGPPVIRTTALVAAGFATLLLSSIPAIQGAGLVLALATILALVYDLFVLPALMIGRRIA